MPTLHKNITASADIHNPKWFPDANNGDVAWRNEKGELESTDELVLPAALNFVDASVAPPTTNDGDIYVLSSGGSVDAGWGAVSLDDWVRYDLANTTWNSITPQKSSLCYNENEDKLYSYDGADWALVGGDSIYTASGTVPTSVVATITDTLTFDGGTVNIQGADTVGTNSAFEIYDGDTVPSSLWDFRNNGDVYQGRSSNWFLNSNVLTFNATNLGALDDPYIKFKLNGGIEIVSTDTDGSIKVLDARTTSSETVFQVGRAINSSGTWNQQDIRIGKIVDNDYIKMANSSVEIVDGGTTRHKFTGVNAYLGGSVAIGSENISLQGDTLVGKTASKVGFMGTAPIVQVTTGVAAATFTANTSGIADDTATFDGYTIGQVVKALRNYGLLA